MARKKQFNDFPFAYHQEIELEVTTLTNLGLGLGRVALEGAAGGWVVMVPYALPGELVRVRVYRNHKNYSEADMVAVVRASEERVAPKCPLFGTCGGCQYQHLRYEAQLQWKQRQVGELLKHMAGIEFPVSPVRGSPSEYGYRSKITPHFERATPDNPGFPIGFLRQGRRHELVDVPRCEIATAAINAALDGVRAEVRKKAAEEGYKRGATLLLRDANGKVATEYDATITETVGALKLHFLARDFFQNNPYILPAFTEYVRDQASASGARYLVDAYCGSGLFALSAATAFEGVAGVEISESSVRFAQENAAANGVTHARFIAGDASAIFAGLEFPASETAVVIDPPRRGSDEAFLRQLFAYGPRSVVYVSCDPATQMRDLVYFREAGYRVTAVQPFDLFPQTRHLECVVTLEKAAG